MALFVAVKELNSKTLTNFMECDHFSKKNFHFQGVSSALEMTFQIQALFKEFKELYEPLCCIQGRFLPVETKG